MTNAAITPAKLSLAASLRRFLGKLAEQLNLSSSAQVRITYDRPWLRDAERRNAR